MRHPRGVASCQKALFFDAECEITCFRVKALPSLWYKGRWATKRVTIFCFFRFVIVVIIIPARPHERARSLHVKRKQSVICQILVARDKLLKFELSTDTGPKSPLWSSPLEREQEAHCDILFIYLIVHLPVGFFEGHRLTLGRSVQRWVWQAHTCAVDYVASIKATRVEGVLLSNAALKKIIVVDFLFDTNTLVRVKTLVQDDNCRRNVKTIQL